MNVSLLEALKIGFDGKTYDVENVSFGLRPCSKIKGETNKNPRRPGYNKV